MQGKSSQRHADLPLSQNQSEKWISRADHSISRKQISENALKILNRLHQHGFEAYLVGGAVRDLLMHLDPKDFDIATNALPYDIRKLFRNSRIIGRRFKLVHVFFGKEIIEISTFRKEPARQFSGSHAKHTDNNYGCLEEDEVRRDFTINALYYHPQTRAIRDQTGGFSDLKKRCIRLIGDPKTRFQEDPVRMLRAVRFAVKIEGSIDAQAEAAIKKSYFLLDSVPKARLFEEWIKFIDSPLLSKHIIALQKRRLIDALFPVLSLQNLPALENLAFSYMTMPVITYAEHYKKTTNRSLPFFFLTACLLYDAIPILKKVSITQIQKATLLNVLDGLLTQQRQSGIPIPRAEELQIIEFYKSLVHFSSKKLLPHSFADEMVQYAFCFLKILSAQTPKDQTLKKRIDMLKEELVVLALTSLPPQPFLQRAFKKQPHRKKYARLKDHTSQSCFQTTVTRSHLP